MIPLMRIVNGKRLPENLVSERENKREREGERPKSSAAPGSKSRLTATLIISYIAKNETLPVHAIIRISSINILFEFSYQGVF